MTGLAALFVLACGATVPAGDAANAVNDVVLFDNGPLVTDPGVEPNGTDSSAVQTQLGLRLTGHAASRRADTRVADDFVVTSPGWAISSFQLYAYQTGGLSTISSFTSVNLRIWDGPPGAPGSNVVFGDATTNVLAGSTFASMYRTTGIKFADLSRPVFAITATVPRWSMAPGTYWLDWQLDGALDSGPYVPPVSRKNQAPTGNARRAVNGTWTDLGDNGGQDLPLRIVGIATANLFSDGFE